MKPKRDMAMRIVAAIFVAIVLGACGSTKVATYKSQPASMPQKSVGGDRGQVLAEAQQWLGTPYRYGGKERTGTDCSGFVMSVFHNSLDISLPRDSRSQAKTCSPLSRRDLQPGDLVFFSGKAGASAISHVGLYVGDSTFIHASTSRGVMFSSLTEPYYRNHFHSAGRVPGLKTNGKEAKVAVTVAAPAAEPVTELSVRRNKETRAPRNRHTSRGLNNVNKKAKAAAPPDTILSAWLD